MEHDNCPKCNGEMDEGQISEVLSYFSNNQTGMIRSSTQVNRARVCLTCGYLELYLQDVDKLKQKIQK